MRSRHPLDSSITISPNSPTEKPLPRSESSRSALAAVALCIPLVWVLTVSSQNPQVGYATIQADPESPLPVATALFSFRNPDGILVSEAGVAAVAPIRRGRLFVDAAIRTGLALANPSGRDLTPDLTLRDGQGNLVDQAQLEVPAGRHTAKYVHDLLGALPEGFIGSLTFEVEGNEGLAALTIRQGTNVHEEHLLAALPVANLAADGAPAGTSPPFILFPHIGAGRIPSTQITLSTQIILINPTAETIRGEIQLTGSGGNPLELQLTTGAAQNALDSVFPFELTPDGVFQGTLTASSGILAQQGYAVVTVDEGVQPPAGTAVFQFREPAGDLISEAGVGAVPATTRARIFVDTVDTRTGVAVASPGNDPVTLAFRLLDRNGLLFAETTRDVPTNGHLACFVDELFDGLPAGFTGILEMSAPGQAGAFPTEQSFVPITLKLTINRRQDPILTTLPVADLTRPVVGDRLVFPQIGFGNGFSTRLILLGGGAEEDVVQTGTFTFTRSDGSPLETPILGDLVSDYDYEVFPSGSAQVRPGDTAAVSQILIDPANGLSSEVVVNRGNRLPLRPLVIDSEGSFRDDFALQYQSLDPEIASIDQRGQITGNQAGFSTLALAAGGVAVTTTITVVEVISGVGGVETADLAQDSARRLYLTNREDHTVLLAEELGEAPEIYAGIEASRGFRNDVRLNSLFDRPGFLALNQADGSLFVSDSENNVIRRVFPGPDGVVETVAGSGEPGSLDGPASQATFNDPQGVALDDRGNLWVADSGNHTIRRINLRAKTVETIAGSPGLAGLTDGTGEQARFSSPAGIALETETIVQQVQRQLRGEPPPPVILVVADTGNGVIRRVREGGQVETIGSPGQNAAHDGRQARLGVAPLLFSAPTGVTVDPFGNVYVTEPEAGQVKVILPNGQVVAAGQADTFSAPRGIVATESGTAVVADAQSLARRIVHGQPAIVSVTPERISNLGGERVTIKGRNFPSDSVVVAAGVVLTPIDIIDTETITFTAPSLASGRTILTIQNRGGLAQTSFVVDPVALNELPQGFITTVAGGATFGGEGLLAIAAALSAEAVAVDAAGDVFLADSFNHRIRRVDARTGIVTTIAGSGQAGFDDGGLALLARLDHPWGVEFDAAGNLFIADAFNDRIRRVDADTGLIATIAGGGDFGFLGDGGPATEAFIKLGEPSGLALDATGNILYVSDVFHNRVRRIDLASGIITTLAGGGAPADGLGDGALATDARLNEPVGLGLDSAGNLFIADRENHRIRRVDIQTGVITTVAGDGVEAFSGDGGPASAASLAGPTGLDFDREGNLLVADSRNSRVRRIDASSWIIETVAGNGDFNFAGDGGPAVDAVLDDPRGIVADAAGNLVIADSGNNRVRKVDGRTGIITTLAGNGEISVLNDNGPATTANLTFPEAVAFDAQGNLLIADNGNFRVRRVDMDQVITTFAGGGSPADSLGDGGPATEAEFCTLYGIAADDQGNLFVADGFDHLVRRIDAQTQIITSVAGTPKQEGFSGDGGPATSAMLNQPRGVAVDGDGNLYIADSANHRIRKVDLSTGIITTAAGTGDADFSGDGGPAAAASISEPLAVAVDSEGNLYIADFGSLRVRRVDSQGIISTVAGGGDPTEGLGDGGLATEADVFPKALFLDGDGNLYITDVAGIRRVDAATGIIETIVGLPLEDGFSGDNGPANQARLLQPSGIAFDPQGNLFIADTFNHRIRAVRGPIP